MKKPLLIFILILVLILALPAISFFRWTFQSKKAINVILVDKTVPNLEREKHKSFNWILTNERFVKIEKEKSYSYKKDYYGFIPKRPVRDKQWGMNEYRVADVITLAEKNDAVYFADTYGVFFNDWYRGLNKSRRSSQLYGGLNNTDFLLISELKNRKKLVILEYNTFDYPTATFESYRIQTKLGITFSGWTGKYFSSLDTMSAEFPIWMTTMYRKQYRQPWTFNKAGIVFLSQKEILVLEEGTHLTNAFPHIITDSTFSEKLGLPSTVAFDRWFDVIDPLENTVISKFKIETTAAGDSMLLENHLFAQFPAVVQDPVDKRTYYFSGDFASTNIPVWTAMFEGVDKLKGLLYSEKPDDTRRFFWLYYKPLINSILSDYYNSINSK
jgi:hypothetical protein